MVKRSKNFEKILKKKAILIEKPAPLGDVEATYAEISHSQKRLGFLPKMNLEEGLRRFVAWYLRNYL